MIWGYPYFWKHPIEVLQTFLPHIIKCEPELLENKTFFVVTHEPSKIIVACGGWSPAGVGTEEVTEGLGHLRQCLVVELGEMLFFVGERQVSSEKNLVV